MAVRYLVTGAGGLLGSHLTEMLVARGERPRVLVRPDESLGVLADLPLTVHRGDLDDPASLTDAVAGAECILHCAAKTGPWGDEAAYHRTNVRGLGALVDAAMNAGVRRIVHVSSITVHGNDVRGSADENSPFHVEPNPYSRTKVAGERLLNEMIRQRCAPVTIVRPGWIYGPRDTASFARFASLVEQGRMLMMGSGRNHVPLVYVDDVARGILLAAEAEHSVGRAYLLVNDEPVTQREYLGAIAARLGAPAPSRRLPYAAALLMGTLAETATRAAGRRTPPPVTRFGIQLLGGENRFSIERARTELGFVPEVMLEEGVRRSVDWYRAAGTRSASELQPA